MNYVIIGNGAASIGVIDGIRSLDKKGSITVVSAEKHHIYGRPLISYYLEGKTDIERMKYRPDGYYEENNVNVLYGETCDKILPDKKKMVVGSKELSYDRLCVCTGSSAFVPPFSGLEAVKNKFSFMTLDDALLLEKTITPESKVLIIGARLIGLKCAEGLKNRVKSITVADLSESVLSSVLDNESSLFVRERLENTGIKFLLGDTAEKFTENTAIMKNGKEVAFDILVLAVGVRANIQLVKEAGGETARGIVTDEKMQTSLNDVYAAGDCAEGFDILSDTRKVIAIMPDAYIGGETAGINMAGGEKELKNSIPMNSMGLFGTHIMTAGAYIGECYSEKSSECIKKLFYKDDLLKGFILIGNVDKGGIYTSLIRNKMPLSSIDFELVKDKPTLIAFTREDRQKKLGDKV